MNRYILAAKIGIFWEMGCRRLEVGYGRDTKYFLQIGRITLFLHSYFKNYIKRLKYTYFQLKKIIHPNEVDTE